MAYTKEEIKQALLNTASESYKIDEKIAKEISEEVSKILVARDICFNKSPIASKFMLGDLVYVGNSGDVGFVVGPIDPYNTLMTKRVSSNDLRYLVVIVKSTPIGNVAISKAIGVPTVPGDPSVDAGSVRVKYPQAKYLKPIFPKNEKFTLNGKVDVSSSCDLSTFCKEQCIMECCPECALYKYGMHS